MGFQVAIDDLGEGFSSLRLWSELRPEYVKADKHFVSGIATDPIKMQFLKAIQQIAESCGTRIIAEGIENEADFRIVRELGVACGQGYLIGRPEEKPMRNMTAEVGRLLADQRVPVPPTPRYRQAALINAQQFMRETVAVRSQLPLKEIITLFEQSPSRYVIPVVEGEMPIGLIARRHVRFLKTIADRDAPELDKTARDIMNVAPLIVDKSTSLMKIASLLSDATPQHMADGFIITDEGRYLGMGSAKDIMRVLTEANLTAARYTNPLTFLPGPVPTNQHIESLLARGQPFVACLAEIDPMKGFNDTYGFQKGDELIRLGGEVLTAVVDGHYDFVGHIYGNRFVMLLQSVDWQTRLTEAMDRFNLSLQTMLTEEIVARGSFVWMGRRGNTEIRPLPRLVIGAAGITSEVCESRHQVMAAAREAVNQAKLTGGSNLTFPEPPRASTGLAA
jgi:GGDEF domain-containing protein